MAGRLALWVMQLGALAVVLVVSTHKAFELDRFLVPKELALHLTALIAGALTLRAFSRERMRWLDLFLVAYLLLGAISVATATNRWLGLRALAVSASAMAIFWAARALRPPLHSLAFVVVVAALTSLLQAYGIEPDLFSENRAPGGTLGNRNFVGHVAAFGLPIILLTALRASRSIGFLLASTGVGIVTAALVLTRSRAAWVAAAAVVVVFFAALLLSPPLRRDGRTWRRLAVAAVLAGGGIAAALLIPNTLRWRSENPYLESVVGVAAYDEGSGRGRLLQYERSLRMTATSPILGVGPGNWAVEYPGHAPPSDRSLNPSEPGTTFNPWPSSDWVAFVAERGVLAASLLALVLAGIAAGGLKRLFRASDAEEATRAASLLATVTAAVLAGMFDAVLLLAVPTLIVWATLGASSVESSAQDGAGNRAFVVVAVLAVVAIGAGRSAAQLVAMDLYAVSDDRESLERAARIDPGSYRLRLRLARSGKNRCAHARAAHALFPHAEAARDLSRRCR